MVRQSTAPTGYGLVQVPKQAGFRLPPIYERRLEKEWKTAGSPCRYFSFSGSLFANRRYQDFQTAYK